METNKVIIKQIRGKEDMIRDWTIKIGVLGTSTIVEGSRQDIMIKVETIK